MVDVDGPTVRQVFQFEFYLYLRDNRFQDWVGWDAEKSGNERRTYPFVYFLRNPQPVTDRNKDFFQVAFGAKKSNFLISQKWFDEAPVKVALAKADVPSIEAFLGIKPQVGHIARLDPPGPPALSKVGSKEPIPSAH